MSDQQQVRAGVPAKKSHVVAALPAKFHRPDDELFIIYQSKEIALVELFQQLFESWGVSAFFCRQEDRVAESKGNYRRDLTIRLRNSKIAIALISRSFKYSDYCHTEVGIVLGRGIWYQSGEPNQTEWLPENDRCLQLIPILIPPVTVETFSHYAPAVEGHDLLTAASPSFCQKLKTNIFACLGRLPQEIKEEEVLTEKIIAEIDRLNTQYLLEPDGRLLYAWPSIDGKTPKAGERIKKELTDSLQRFNVEDGWLMPSTFTLIGVSLKYSLDLVEDVLRRLSQSALETNNWMPNRSKKELYVDIVHMDSMSSALHNIRDQRDIGKIQESFGIGTLKANSKWNDYCKNIGVDLHLSVYAIDFVPPRTGLLVDKKFLLEGSCAYEALEDPTRIFEKRESTERDKPVIPTSYRLLVGEQEYTQYVYDETVNGEAQVRALERIKLFRSYFDLYKLGEHNTLLFALDGRDWEDRLIESMKKCSSPNVTFMSQTVTKFQPLIKAAIGLDKAIVIIANATINQEKFDSLIVLLREWVAGTSATIELRRSPRDQTFRAVLIGDETIGYQAYKRKHSLIGSEVRLIIRYHSAYFKTIGTMVISEVADQLRTAEGNAIIIKSEPAS